MAGGTILSGAFNGGSRFSDLTLQAGTSLNLNGQTTNWGTLSGAGSVYNSVANAPVLYVGFNNGDSTFSGQLNRFNDSTPNSVSLSKVGSGVMTITGVQHAQNGSTGSLFVEGGVLSYANGGTALLPNQFVREGGTLRLDNSVTNTPNRLASVLTATPNSTLNISGGRVEVIPHATIDTFELVTTLTVGNGAGELVLDAVAGSGILITATNLSGVQNGGTLWLRSDFNAPGVSGTADGFANLAVTNFPNYAGQATGANGTFNMLVRSDIIGSALDGSGLAFVTKDSLHDPTRQNWPVLEHAVIGNIVPDFPLINKSFNLSYAGHDL